MHNLILSPISLTEFDSLIKMAVKTALDENKQPVTTEKAQSFRYVPIQDIFDKKICSKPTFYEHLKAGEFSLYKFGNKSFVDIEEFTRAFKKVKISTSNIPA